MILYFFIEVYQFGDKFRVFSKDSSFDPKMQPVFAGFLSDIKYHIVLKSQCAIVNRSICLILIGLLRSVMFDRSKPIIALYLQSFATVTLKLTVAKIGKYGIMIGLLRLAEASQSE